MDDIRYKNLYDAITSYIDYTNYIESNGEDEISFENTNFDLLQTIYGAYSLTQLMEDYFKINKDKVTSTLMPEALKQIVKIVATYNGSKYIVGDIIYDDENTVLVKLRNKLAHGDFIIREGEIIFEDFGYEGRVKVDDFLRLITSLEHEADDYTLSAPHTKVFSKYLNQKNIEKITNEKELDIFCNNLYRIEIIDKPLVPMERDIKYVSVRKEFYDITVKKIEKLPIEGIQQYLEHMKPILKKHGIQITYSIKNIKKLDYYPNIKEKYMVMNDIYKVLSLNEQINRISNLSYILGNGRYQKMDTKKGLMLNRYLMKHFKENPNKRIKEIIFEDRSITRLLLYHFNSAIIASYLVGFNSAYEYGLEKGLTKKGCYNLVSVFEGKSLDFSKLQLILLDDPNMLIEHTFDKFLTDVNEYETKEIEKVDRLIEKLENRLKQYINNCKNINQNKINEFNKNINEAKNLKLELEKKIEELKEFSSNFDLERYTRNINTITHIRNAIAHGNVFIDSYATNINDTQIIFRDYLNDKIVYEKKMRISEFTSIFHHDNIGNVYKFIINNISDKTLIDEDFYQKAADRRLLRIEKEPEEESQLVKYY